MARYVHPATRRMLLDGSLFRRILARIERRGAGLAPAGVSPRRAASPPKRRDQGVLAPRTRAMSPAASGQHGR